MSNTTNMQIVRGEKETLYAETKTELSELEKLLSKGAVVTAAIPNAPMVRVRCNRSLDKWVIVDDQNNELELVDHMILMNAAFTSRESDEFLQEGCGGYWDNIGFAVGQRLPAETPIRALNELIHGLGYNREAGCFVCGTTRRIITAAAFLILKDGCSSEYVALPTEKPAAKAKAKRSRKAVAT